MSNQSPIIYDANFSKDSINQIDKSFSNKEEAKYILNYPTVYIVHNKNKQKYTVYVGETTNIKRRTIEHISNDPKVREDWEQLVESKSTEMLIIGHHHFNKSLTLDIENKLMQYLSSVDVVEKVNNRRTNQQNLYYTSDELETIFSKVWQKLRQKNKELFPLEKVIKDSALFKASPFHKLTEEQLSAKDTILLKIEEALNRNLEGQLILVEGEAGAGKTVLMSSLFYELQQLSKDTSDNVILRNTSQCLLVNHDQQLLVYTQIAKKLGLLTKQNPNIVSKPTIFINSRTPNEKTDVVIVDEAHLLLTRGKQSYRGKNHLEDLLDRAKVVVIVFDKNQILSSEQYWENKQLIELRHQANLNGNLIQLENQLRINGDKETIHWIRNIIDNSTIKNIPHDSKGYTIKIFDDPQKMFEEIKDKAVHKKLGISRMLATFDWPYIDKKDNNGNPWYVTIGNWKMPWNLQQKLTRKEKKAIQDLAWAEQPHTINEVGSTFTIQGFDLNYAGVIIGPSVKYRNGKIIFDKTESKNKKATYRRTLENGIKADVSEQLLKNELNVLLTRGVNGLFIYAVDEQLRNALLEAQKGELNDNK